MSEKTVNELDIIVDNLKEHINDKFNDVNARLDTLTSTVNKTNGRVKSLELWKSFMIGGLTILSMIVIPLLIWIFNSPNLIKPSIAEEIKNDLQGYFIQPIKQ